MCIKMLTLVITVSVNCLLYKLVSRMPTNLVPKQQAGFSPEVAIDTEACQMRNSVALQFPMLLK